MMITMASRMKVPVEFIHILFPFLLWPPRLNWNAIGPGPTLVCGLPQRQYFVCLYFAPLVPFLVGSIAREACSLL
jgi:hypothetical protein